MVREIPQDWWLRKGSWQPFQDLKKFSQWVLFSLGLNQRGKFFYTPVFDKALKKDDFPTLGRPRRLILGLDEIMRKNIYWDKQHRPTIPIFKLLLGRPRRAFFSFSGAFLGGIFFLAKVGWVVENWREQPTKRRKPRNSCLLCGDGREMQRDVCPKANRCLIIWI